MFNSIDLLSAISPNAMTAAVSNSDVISISSNSHLLDILGIGFLVFILLTFGLFILMIVSTWIIYQKADQPGWTSIIPIYNIVKLLDIIKKPAIWVLLIFIPMVNIFFVMYLSFKLAKSFGKSDGFSLFTALIPIIFYPIIAFDKSKYIYSNRSAESNSNINDTNQFNQNHPESVLDEK